MNVTEAILRKEPGSTLSRSIRDYTERIDWSMIIRKAVPADEKRIRELFEEMLRTIYQTDSVEGYEDGYLDQYWNGGENVIYVAEDRDVIAFLSVQVYHEPEEYIYMDDFSVTEAWRNKGVGTELILKAEDYAKQLKIPALLLHVEKKNEAAFRFYTRSGYTIYRDDGSRYLMIKKIWIS